MLLKFIIKLLANKNTPLKGAGLTISYVREVFMKKEWGKKLFVAYFALIYKLSRILNS
jgi:hypothetical protein